MARKDLLKGLMPDNPEATTKVQPDASAKARYNKGAIGAVSQSIAELKSRALVEIDPNLIKDSEIVERLDYDDGLKELIDSIREHGQQVPVLVRPHPKEDGQYQIVYGRRRVFALRELNSPVRAMIRDLTDTELVIAQGQENNIRKDLSFIEKARFTLQLDSAGYPRKVISDAINIDQSLISRMIAVASAIPEQLIRAIGPAPGIGRDRWMALAKRVDAGEEDRMIALAIGKTSDERFLSLMTSLERSRKPTKDSSRKSETEVLSGEKGIPIGTLKRSQSRITITLPRKDSNGFEDWLIANFTEIHRRYTDERGE